MVLIGIDNFQARFHPERITWRSDSLLKCQDKNEDKNENQGFHSCSETKPVTNKSIQWSMTLTDMKLTGKKCYDRAFHLVNKLHDFKGIHDLRGDFCYDDCFRKSHARLYLNVI